jgi:hypothetical protein
LQIQNKKGGIRFPAFFIFPVLILSFFFTSCYSKDSIRKEILEEMKPPRSSSRPQPSPDQPPLPAGPLQTASLEKILNRLRLDSLDFKTLKANAQVFFFKNDASYYQNCEAVITYERPGRFFIKGYKELVPNFFTLAAHEGQFWFEAPRYKTVYNGFLNRLSSSGGFELLLDPLLLEKSFLAAPLAADEFAEMETVEAPYYLLSVFKNEGGLKILKRKLWINRENLSVERETYFSPQGIPELEFIRKNYSNDPFLSFPKVIEFQNLKEGKKVRLELKSLELNAEIPYGKFQYQPPAGTVLEVVN